jgi:4-hydroxybenzoate polyprenyltransferase
MSNRNQDVIDRFEENPIPAVDAGIGSRRWAFIKLLRPQQWTKNLLVLAALLFAGQLHSPHHIRQASLAFLAFCLASSSVYVVNDLLDQESDRQHPRKRHRPIAAGIIGPRAAVLMAMFCLACAGGLILMTTYQASCCLAAYLVVQAGYVSLLRHQVLLDVFAISVGFILRAAAGALAIAVTISPWLLICTLLLALFLALSKRRSEILVSADPGRHRRVLGAYTIALLDQLITVVTSCAVLAYILYTFSEQTSQKFHTRLMPLTIPFVLYGIFRYLYLIHQKAGVEEPEMILLKDMPLLTGILLWVITVAFIINI